MEQAELDLGLETIKSKLSQMSSGTLGYTLQDRLKNRSSLLVAATGTGKTVMMASMAKHWPQGRILVLSHRFELSQQAIKEFENWCQEEVDLEQASYRADQYGRCCRIVVASVQTLNSKVRSHKSPLRGKFRMAKFYPQDFGLVLIDEVHHATAVTYQRVIEHFASNPNCRFVGVTATPDRLDKVGMGNIFSHVGCDYNLKWAVENGWLVEPKQKFVQVDGLDMSKIKTVRGDLDQSQLSRLVEMEETLHSMAEPIVDVAGPNDQAIVFTASVAQAHRLAELIRDYCHRKFGHGGLERAVSIDGKLSPQDPRRRQIVSQFREGQIQFLVNCGVATEGFDAPEVKVIAVGRPTKSRALYTQMIGRGTRPLPGLLDGLGTPEQRKQAIDSSDKPHCTVLDFMGQAGRHQLVCTSDILSTENDPPEVIKRARQIVQRQDFDGGALDALRKAREEERRLQEAKRARLTVGVDYQLKDANSIYDTAWIAEVKAPGYLKNKPATDKQVKFMLRLGYTMAQCERMNPRQASKAIDHAIRNPRNSFAKWLYTEKKKKGEL